MVIDVVKLERHLFTNITWSHDRWVTWLDGCGQLNLSHTLLKLVTTALVKVEIFFNITWSHDQRVTWLSWSDTLNLNHKGYSERKKINNKNIYVLQIGAALFYYRLEQTLLQIGQLHYYKLGQLLQNRAAITSWGKINYKLGQVLQIWAIITNWGKLTL